MATKRVLKKRTIKNRNGCRLPYYGEIDACNNREAQYIFLNNRELPLLEKEIIEDEAIDPDYEMLEFKQQIYRLIDDLTKTERAIMLMHYKYDLTGHEIGKLILLSGQRVYQIINKCIRKIRNRIIVEYSSLKADDVDFNYLINRDNYNELMHEARKKGLEKNVPNEILHSKEWFERYNVERNKVDYGKAYTLPVTPYWIYRPEAQSPVVKKQIPKIDIYKVCRYSYSSFPIYVWAEL